MTKVDLEKKVAKLEETAEINRLQHNRFASDHWKMRDDYVDSQQNGYKKDGQISALLGTIKVMVEKIR